MIWKEQNINFKISQVTVSQIIYVAWSLSNMDTDRQFEMEGRRKLKMNFTEW